MKEMQHLLSNDQELQINHEAEVQPKESLWGQLGPSLLLGSFAVLLLKSASLYWPLALTAVLGYITLLYLRRKGLFLSLCILATTFVLLRTKVDFFWPLMLSISIALSWTLIFLGNEARISAQEQQEENLSRLQESCKDLERRLHVAKVAISQESKDLVLEKEQLHTQLKQLQQALQLSEKEKDKLLEKCEALSQDAFTAQRKEIAFQHALEDAQTQLLKLKNQMASLPESPKEVMSNIIPMEEANSEEKIRIEQIQHQYANLREQFEEKSTLLDQARQELFKMENGLLSLQRTKEEELYEFPEESLALMAELKKMQEQVLTLETEVTILQDFITSLLEPKKRTPRSKKSSVKSAEQEGFLETFSEFG